MPGALGPVMPRGFPIPPPRLLSKPRRPHLDRPEQVAAVAGADMALRLLPRLLSAATVAVLSPTYTGHREGWRAAGAAVREVARDSAFLDADVVVVVNPNNPDGVLLTTFRCVHSRPASAHAIASSSSISHRCSARSRRRAGRRRRSHRASVVRSVPDFRAFVLASLSPGPRFCPRFVLSPASGLLPPARSPRQPRPMAIPPGRRPTARASGQRCCSSLTNS